MAYLQDMTPSPGSFKRPGSRDDAHKVKVWSQKLARSPRRRAGVEPLRVARERTSRQLVSWTAAIALATALVFGITVMIGIQALVSVTGHHLGSGVFGFLLGGYVVSAVWVVWEASMRTDGSWAWRVGAMAEDWTSQVVERHLGRRWRFRYNVVFHEGPVDRPLWWTDIDCVATGPYGVLAISTKWTADDWDLSDPKDYWLIAAARQASKNAKKLEPQVRTIVPNSPVVPLVVCWGPQLSPITNVVSRVIVDGTAVLVVYGPQSKQWVATFDAERLSDDEVTSVDNRVGRFIDDYEKRKATTASAKSRAERVVRVSVWATQAAVAITIVAMAWIVAASLNRSVLHAFASFARFGDGIGGVLFLLVPTLLLVGSAVFALKANRWSTRARAITNSRFVLVEPMVGLGVWLILLVVLSIAG